MPSEDPFVSALKQLCEREGGHAKVAMRSKLSAANLHQIISGVKLPSGNPRGVGPSVRKALSAAYPDWLALAGNSGAHLPAGAGVTSDYLPGFETLSIPVLAQAGSMGLGEDQMHDEIVIGRLTVSPEWALKTLKPTKLENLRFIHGYGDSMEGTFADGDILLVDSGVTDPKIDGVYVLEANQRIYIKRVRQRMDGAFEISSDNPNVKTVDVLDGRAQVTVHGRVIWAWNGKKM